jgi:exopolyphosphatase/guanosine-5'-triphosphate,3'-diphosphate pyrophosphatase
LSPNFPLRVAAIDVGSNAIRFLAAEFTDRDRFSQIDYVRAPVRMGHDAFRTGRLTDESMEAGIEALAGFRRRMDALEVAHYRAVATSAVRDSRNGSEFVQRVAKECDLRLEPITGAEEARLVWLAARSRVELDEGEWILVDLGGGSVEISRIDDRRVHWSESQPLGTVRLLEEVEELGGDSPERIRRMLEDHTAMLKISAVARGLEVAGMIATGGNIEELAELAEVEADARGVRTLPVKRLHRTLEELARLSPRERIERFGLREDRADVIVPAAMVYERIALMVGSEEIVVPDVGVKEGLLLDVVDDLTEHGAHERNLEHEVQEGALATGRRFGFDETHARQVAGLAISLFDQLQEEHELGEAERRVLLAGALLHDVGQFISYRRHHRHSHYLISNSELPGFTPGQIELVALVARYHRRAEPKDAHPEYAALPRDDQSRVRRLAALLRVADALDREHEQKVSAVEARVADGEVELEIRGSGDLLLEQWALQKKSRMFEQEFDLAVRATLRSDPE